MNRIDFWITGEYRPLPVYSEINALVEYFSNYN